MYFVYGISKRVFVLFLFYNLCVSVKTKNWFKVCCLWTCKSGIYMWLTKYSLTYTILLQMLQNMSIKQSVWSWTIVNIYCIVLIVSFCYFLRIFVTHYLWTGCILAKIKKNISIKVGLNNDSKSAFFIRGSTWYSLQKRC